jgi:predicted ATPase
MFYRSSFIIVHRSTIHFHPQETGQSYLSICQAMIHSRRVEVIVERTDEQQQRHHHHHH